MTNLPALISPNQDRIMPAAPDRDTKYRLGRFVEWLDRTGRTWQQPDMAAYRDYLLSEHGLKASTVQTHLSTIRGRYSALLGDNAVRDGLWALTPSDAGIAERKAFVDEALTRIENAIKPQAAKVTVTMKQDRADAEHLRLTKDQADALIAAPGTDTLAALRDTALIALMLCTGIREFELCALKVEDLRQRLDGTLALHIRAGKGAKARLVPYGAQEWVIALVEAWTRAAGITDGPVFRGFYKGNRRLHPGALTVRAVQDILAAYPVSIDGQMQAARPHDLRRTYARRLYEAGMDIERIRQNLGHADVKTTQLYIGALGAELRKPPSLFRQPRIPTGLI